MLGHATVVDSNLNFRVDLSRKRKKFDSDCIRDI